MKLRKLLTFKTILGITLPKDYTNVLGLKYGEYVEVLLKDNKTIVIKKLEPNTNRLSIHD